LQTAGTATSVSTFTYLYLYPGWFYKGPHFVAGCNRRGESMGVAGQGVLGFGPPATARVVCEIFSDMMRKFLARGYSQGKEWR